MNEKMKLNLSDEEIRKAIEDVFDNMPKSERTMVLYCFSQKGLEMFDKAFKEEVNRIYGKEDNDS